MMRIVILFSFLGCWPIANASSGDRPSSASLGFDSQPNGQEWVFTSSEEVPTQPPPEKDPTGTTSNLVKRDACRGPNLQAKEDRKARTKAQVAKAAEANACKGSVRSGKNGNRRRPQPLQFRTPEKPSGRPTAECRRGLRSKGKDGTKGLTTARAAAAAKTGVPAQDESLAKVYSAALAKARHDRIVAEFKEQVWEETPSMGVSAALVLDAIEDFSKFVKPGDRRELVAGIYLESRRSDGALSLQFLDY